MRVNGALFFNLAGLVPGVEPPRVCVGSFWDKPYAPGTYHELFEAEEKQLMHDLHDVVRQNLDRKVASLMKR